MVSDAVVIAAIGGLVALSTTISTIIIAWLNSRTRQAVERNANTMARAADDAAQRSETLHTTIEAGAEKLENLARVGKDTHKLMNGRYGVQLRLAAGALRRLADVTKSKADLEAAQLAEQALAYHMANQKGERRGKPSDLIKPPKRK